MLDYARLAPGEPFDRAIVTVTFMRMNHLPARALLALPANATLTPERLSVGTYRALYDEIGAPFLWWLRRVMPEPQLAKHLANAAVSIHLLRVNDEVAGFFETESSNWPDVNLNYFGLRQRFMGQGLGRILLDQAIASVFRGAVGLRGLTVNTCTADHPRALPNYLAAGFLEVRRVKEIWDVPRRLGMRVPAHVRA